ncbi:MAG: hypothetical protein WC695_08155 [Candidatus Omnitrophota bacterium]
MEKTLRKRDFKLGQIHGRLQAENDKSEAQIQRTVFLSQKLKIWRKRNEATTVRIFGYEVPLKTGCTRGECIDLIGYDKDYNLYLIELKKKESQERIPDIIEQLNGYENSIKQILPYIKEEFKNEYFLPINFEAVKKIILAPREFYETRKKDLIPGSIEYAYFGDRDINKRKPGEIINIHLVRK